MTLILNHTITPVFEYGSKVYFKCTNNHIIGFIVGFDVRRDIIKYIVSIEGEERSVYDFEITTNPYEKA